MNELRSAGTATVARKLPGRAVEAMTFPDASADVVLSNAVLHFARDASHFRAMLDGTWRVLKPGGLFFSRLASSIGIESRIRALGPGRLSTWAMAKR